MSEFLEKEKEKDTIPAKLDISDNEFTTATSAAAPVSSESTREPQKRKSQEQDVQVINKKKPHDISNNSERDGSSVSDVSFDLTTMEGQLSINPTLTLDDAKFRAKREYHRQNAARARVRNKEKVVELQQQLAAFTKRTATLERENAVLKAQYNVLMSQQERHNELQQQQQTMMQQQLQSQQLQGMSQYVTNGLMTLIQGNQSAQQVSQVSLTNSAATQFAQVFANQIQHHLQEQQQQQQYQQAAEALGRFLSRSQDRDSSSCSEGSSNMVEMALPSTHQKTNNMSSAGQLQHQQEGMERQQQQGKQETQQQKNPQLLRFPQHVVQQLPQGFQQLKEEKLQHIVQQQLRPPQMQDHSRQQQNFSQQEKLFWSQQGDIQERQLERQEHQQIKLSVSPTPAGRSDEQFSSLMTQLQNQLNAGPSSVMGLQHSDSLSSEASGDIGKNGQAQQMSQVQEMTMQQLRGQLAQQNPSLAHLLDQVPSSVLQGFFFQLGQQDAGENVMFDNSRS